LTNRNTLLLFDPDYFFEKIRLEEGENSARGGGKAPHFRLKRKEVSTVFLKRGASQKIPSFGFLDQEGQAKPELLPPGEFGSDQEEREEGPRNLTQKVFYAIG